MSPPVSESSYGLWAGLLTGRVRSVRRPMGPYAGGFRLDWRAEIESDGVPSAIATARTTARGGYPPRPSPLHCQSLPPSASMHDTSGSELCPCLSAIYGAAIRH